MAAALNVGTSIVEEAGRRGTRTSRVRASRFMLHNPRNVHPGPDARLARSIPIVSSLPFLTPSLQIRRFNSVRRIEHAWRHGELAGRMAWIVTIVLLSILAISLWQGRRLEARILRLQSRVGELQSDLAAKSSAKPVADLADFAQALPDAPSAAQIMQTLQQAADKEGASVVSLQAEDHPPTQATFGHLDLAISIKATYPAILVVLQQALDRYPGATVRQFNLAHVVAPTGMAPMAVAPAPGATVLQPASEAEAHVLLSFWRRPLDMVRSTPALAPALAASAAPGFASAAPAGPVAVDAAAAPVAATPSSGGR